MSQNFLGAESSPYLLQHKDNPVHWRPWGDAALAEAKATGKPILLSVGYAACHWCHVMAHESFENDDIAGVMNELFVNIKVDREERPDVDTIYQSALAMMGQQGGWPLTMFLTPDGEPFWGGTYFPPASRFGRPAFTDVLQGVARTYHQEPEKVQKNVAALKDGLERMARPEAGQGLSLEMLDKVAVTAQRLIDPIRGGTADAPKFPQPVFFRFLWRAWRRTGSVLFREAVGVTLDHLCQGGIYDHVGGGFARYATDDAWLVPHFEKMLYDNALLVDLMTEVWRETHSPLYRRRVRETIEWVLRELKTGETGAHFGLASAYDADSEGVEGKFYIWSEEEIDRILGADAGPFKTAFGIRRGGNWEGHNILNRLHDMRLRDAADEAKLEASLLKLRGVRAERVWPQRDDKVLADWNGLMISGMARAAVAFGEPAWLEAARAVFSFIETEMADGERLFHTWCAGRARHPAVIDDYANMAAAALALFEASGDEAYLSKARAWVEVADRHHWDSQDGGYFLSADDTRDVIVRTKPAMDNATPSGNGTMMEVLARLWLLTGESGYRERCDTLARLFSDDNLQHLIAVPGLLSGFELLDRGRQAVVVGAPDDSGTVALIDAVVAAAEPLTVLTRLAPGAALPPEHPAAGKTTVDGAATAYVCVGPTCGLPITEPDALRLALEAR